MKVKVFFQLFVSEEVEEGQDPETTIAKVRASWPDLKGYILEDAFFDNEEFEEEDDGD